MPVAGHTRSRSTIVVARTTGPTAGRWRKELRAEDDATTREQHDSDAPRHVRLRPSGRAAPLPHDRYRMGSISQVQSSSRICEEQERQRNRHVMIFESISRASISGGCPC